MIEVDYWLLPAAVSRWDQQYAPHEVHGSWPATDDAWAEVIERDLAAWIRGWPSGLLERFEASLAYYLVYDRLVLTGQPHWVASRSAGEEMTVERIWLPLYRAVFGSEPAPRPFAEYVVVESDFASSRALLPEGPTFWWEAPVHVAERTRRGFDSAIGNTIDFVEVDSVQSVVGVMRGQREPVRRYEVIMQGFISIEAAWQVYMSDPLGRWVPPDLRGWVEVSPIETYLVGTRCFASTGRQAELRTEGFRRVTVGDFDWLFEILHGAGVAMGIPVEAGTVEAQEAALAMDRESGLPHRPWHAWATLDKAARRAVEADHLLWIG